jgi:hypothetical protein
MTPQDAPRERRAPPLYAKLLLLVGGLVLGLVVLEVGVRIGFGDRIKGARILRSEDLTNPGIPGIPYVYSPGRGDFVNNLGLRMPNHVTPEKPPGTLRLLLLADSVGEVIDGARGPADLFPNLLQGLLEERLDREVEVLNLAVPGFSLEQERRLMEVRRTEWDADAAIFVYCYNDPSETGFGQFANIPILELFSFADAAALVLYELRSEEDTWYTPGSMVYTDLEASFVALGVAAADYPIFIAPLPMLLEPGAPQPHIPVVTELSRRNGIPFLDLPSRLPGDLTRFILPDAREDQIHYNAQGHVAVAAALAELLVPRLRERFGPSLR